MSLRKSDLVNQTPGACIDDGWTGHITDEGLDSSLAGYRIMSSTHCKHSVLVSIPKLRLVNKSQNFKIGERKYHIVQYLY